MLLDDLVGVIELLKERIATHGPSLRENETRTRMALIDPLLQALGWDTSDPEMVTPEYSVGASRADYALLTSTGNPSALVEAKKLDESLASHRMQMLNYANISGIPHAGLTDGNHWEMYTVFDQAPIEQRRILDVSIANTPAHEAALKLLLLWRPNLASGQPSEANAPVYSETPKVVETGPIASYQNAGVKVQVEHSPERGIAETTLEPPTEVTERGWRPISEVVPKPGDAPPSRMRLTDGSERELRRAWAAVVENTAEWLWGNGLLSLDKVPIQSSNRRNIVNTRPLHPGDNEFNQPAQIVRTPLWVERNISGRAAAANARTLLEQCGGRQDAVFLWFD